MHNQSAMFPKYSSETHLETGDPARLPAQLVGWWRQRNWKSVRWGKILYWGDKSSQGKTKISCTCKTSQTNKPRVCPLWVLIHLSFNSQQGSPLSSLSGIAFHPAFLLLLFLTVLLHKVHKVCEHTQKESVVVGAPHKVLIYIEHHSACPFVGIGTPPPL